MHLPKLMSAKTVAAEMARLGLPLSIRSVTYHAKERSCPIESKSGVIRYRWPEYLAWWHARDVAAAEARSAPADLNEARTRKTAAEAELAELELEEQRGNLIRVDDAALQVAKVLERVRARLVAMPGTLGPRLAGLETATACEAIVARAIHDTLTELSGAQ